MDNNQGSSSMSGSANAGTGTRNSTYDLTAVLYHALQGVENCQTYMGDAEGKQEHRQFFQLALDSQKQLAEQAKRLLHDALMKETGGGQGGSQSSGGSSGLGQSHSFEEARDDGSAFRFASSETEGGSDQFAGQGSEQDRQGGSALTSGQQVGGMDNDQGSGQFGQSALGHGQRHNEMTTGGGGTSSF
ncbi:hypothetical protein [Sphingomonas sp. LHG3406-1]|uniref:hypothetical protein n=1 Tax=Sphingomonas sp. LHG3406-1 TaxID=2804617 RepID=UPI0026140643|nr:hypothetical protein [Sphingomonas sp. LHG3406-1]